MYCQRCDQQGAIYKAKIVPTNEIVYICDECDGVWKEPAKILQYETSVYERDFFDLTSFLQQANSCIAPKVENLGYDWDL